MTVTLLAAPSPGPLPAGADRSMATRFTSVPVRSLTVMVGVGAAGGIELDVLDAVEVDGDSADVAGETRPLAIGRDVDRLGDVGAVEHERIGARLAFDRVAGVAGIPDKRVVAAAEKGRVVAATAGDRVVAGAAVERERRIAGGQQRRRERIVAGAARDDQRIGCLRAADGDRLRQAGDRQRAALALHRDDAVGLGGVDGDGSAAPSPVWGVDARSM